MASKLIILSAPKKWAEELDKEWDARKDVYASKSEFLRRVIESGLTQIYAKSKNGKVK
jgi:hypothetical protein